MTLDRLLCRNCGEPITAADNGYCRTCWTLAKRTWARRTTGTASAPPDPEARAEHERRGGRS